MYKRIFAIILAVCFLASCSATTGGNQIGRSIKIKNEKIVKQYKGSHNVYKRDNDFLMIAIDEEEVSEDIKVDIKTGEIEQNQGLEMYQQYIYYERVADKGVLYIQQDKNDEKQNQLVFKDKKNNDRIIAENVGVFDSINISISPNADRIIYTVLRGDNQYSLYIYDIASSSNKMLMEKADKEITNNFDYLVNWSPDGKFVIIKERYIYDATRAALNAELKAAYTMWSPTGNKIAYIVEEDPQKWLNISDATVYPGKRICVYDLYKKSFKDAYNISNEDYVLGNISWSQDENKIAFIGTQIKDTTQQEWYMNIKYTSVYIVNIEDKKPQRIEIDINSENGSMVELSSVNISKSGDILGLISGNNEKSDMFVYNVQSLETKSFSNVEYLHWVNNENFVVSSEQNYMYFCMDNSIIRLDKDLNTTVMYTSKSKLDDFYLSADEKNIIIIEVEEDNNIIRHIEI